jgi:hypothetical protein
MSYIQGKMQETGGASKTAHQNLEERHLPPVVSLQLPLLLMLNTVPMEEEKRSRVQSTITQQALKGELGAERQKID